MVICPLSVYEARMVRREKNFRDHGFHLTPEHADCRELIHMVERLRGLLADARCPTEKCDGAGVIWLGGDGSNIEQCQWCYEKGKYLDD